MNLVETPKFLLIAMTVENYSDLRPIFMLKADVQTFALVF